MASENKCKKAGFSARKPCMKAYNAEKRWEKNKIRRMRRHIRRFPNDKQAIKLLTAL